MRRIIDIILKILLKGLKISARVTLFIFSIASLFIGIFGLIANIRTKNINGIIASIIITFIGLFCAFEYYWIYLIK